MRAMYDKPDEEKSILEKMRYWLREESDMLWLSIGVFFMIIIAGAFFFDHTDVIPGWVQSDVNDQGTLIDIEWNNDGTYALAIFLDLEEGNKILKSWDDENPGWKVIESNSEPNAVDYAGDYAGFEWFIGTNDGIEVMNDSNDELIYPAINWIDNSSSKRIVDISSISGISGFIITQSIEGSSVHYFDFNKGEVSVGTSPPSTSDGENEGHVELTQVEMISSQRALVTSGLYSLIVASISDGALRLKVTVLKSFIKSKPQSSFVLISFFNLSSEERVHEALEPKLL